MKEKFEMPEVEVIKFDGNEVGTLSIGGGINLGGGGTIGLDSGEYSGVFQ